MADTVLLVLVVLVGLGWVVFAAAVLGLLRELSPRLKRLSALMDKAESFLVKADEERLLSRAGAILAEVETAAAEMKARLVQMEPLLAKGPEIQSQVIGAAGGLNTLLAEVNSSGLAAELKSLLANAGEAVDRLKSVLSDLDDAVGKAKAARDAVSEGIQSTREKVEDAITLIGGVKAGIAAGLRALTGRD
ncbi:MAG: hypothetical protein HRF49_03025 [bacterium]